MQVLVRGMHLHVASPFPAVYFDASLGAGDALKRSQPRQTVRLGLLPLEQLGGTALVGVAHAAAGSRLRRLPCSLAARLLVFSLRCSPRPSAFVVTPSSEHRHTEAARRGEGGSERSRVVWRRWNRAGRAVNATETGRRGLGTVPSGDGLCLARA